MRVPPGQGALALSGLAVPCARWGVPAQHFLRGGFRAPAPGRVNSRASVHLKQVVDLGRLRTCARWARTA